MGKDLTKMKNVEPLADYRLQAVFQRKLAAKKEYVKFALKAMYKCCRKMIPGNNIGGGKGVALLGTKTERPLPAGQLFHRTGFHGTVKCHNLWACPVCAAAALTERARTLTMYLADVSRQYKAFMVTYTIPHTRKMSAGFVIEKFKQVRRKAFHGAAERFQKRVLRCLGTVTTNEVTYTPYGWHLHQHVLYVVPRSTSANDCEEFCRLASAGWNGALEREFPGFKEGKYKSGAAVKVTRNRRGKILNITDGRYLYGYGSELSKSRGGRRGVFKSRTLFDLIEGTEEDFDLLCEWLLASRGKHRITLSHSIKARMDKLASEKKTTCTNIETSVVGIFGASDWANLTDAEIATGLPLRYGVAKAALCGYDSAVKFLARHCPDVRLAQPSGIVSLITGTITENLDADWKLRKRNVERKKPAKDACIHEDILALAATREENLRRIEEYRRWATATYSASIGEQSGAADIG